MSFLEQIPLIGPYLGYAIPFLIVLTIVVFVHEYGHFIVARWCGVASEAFSIGFGPELFGWRDKRGTRWKFSAIPLGGYVKFRGDTDAASTRPDTEALEAMTDQERAGAFPTASLPRRSAIVFAGPAFNFILSILLFAVLALSIGVSGERAEVGYLEKGGEAEKAGFQLGDKLLEIDGQAVGSFPEFHQEIRESIGEERIVKIERDGGVIEIPFTFQPPIAVQTVRSGSAAGRAGIEPGDLIVAVNGKPIRLFDELREAVTASEGAPVDLTLERDGKTLDVTATPEMREIRDENGNIVTRYLLGVTHTAFMGVGAPAESTGIIDALKIGVEQTWNILTMTVFFLYELIAGRGDVGELGGPLRIAEFSGQAAQAGLDSLIRLTAVLSASIGLINLFPIPVLDGGHLLFYAIEAVRGKPLNERAQEIGLTIGFALIVMLMLFATYNDVIRL